MQFAQNEVKKLAHLARLAMNEDSETSIAEDLRKILQFVDRISEIKTDAIEPMEHSQNSAQRCRADLVTEPNVRDAMQKMVGENAKAAGLYLVPRVVE